MRSIVRLLALGLVAPSLAGAQVGIHVGVAKQSGERDFYPGYSLGATYSLRSTAPIALRFALGFQSFAHVGVYTTPPPPCLPPSANAGPCSGATPRGNHVTAFSTTASVVIAEHPGRNTFYWVAGLGVYAFTATPSDGAYRRAGWNVGGGFNLGSKVVFDLRYDRLIDPRTTRALVPITLGFRF